MSLFKIYSRLSFIGKAPERTGVQGRVMIVLLILLYLDSYWKPIFVTVMIVGNFLMTMWTVLGNRKMICDSF